MGGLSTIPRTATFTWSPDPSSQTLATGTKAGAVDEDFSNDTQLELWDLSSNARSTSGEAEPIATVGAASRFNDIAWTTGGATKPQGIIAGALESGTLELWDAERLAKSPSDASIEQSLKHSGAIKALQFNTFKSELLASVGAKGELFISDINNIDKSSRIGNAVARADDYDCLDWNRKASHIMATGSSGGIVTVWDIKNKRESLTLNKIGRKSVSAVAWDPAKATGMVTATSSDSDPLIMMWDLRNPNAPERVFKGHDAGILSLAWCQQDTSLLLSCGKDNRTICWNTQTTEILGEFPTVTNWTFQTKWNPRNPNFIATAAFDGKISVNTVQNVAQEADASSAKAANQTFDDEDFFNKAQSRPQGASFSLMKPPKWLQRPCGTSFGFGGKLATFRTPSADTKRSVVRISTFSIDDNIASSAAAFETSLKGAKMDEICETKASQAENESEKADWDIIKILSATDRKSAILEYLGFATEIQTAAASADVDMKNQQTGKHSADQATNGDVGTTKNAKQNRLSNFFDESADGDDFSLGMGASKGAGTNDPFHVYSDSLSQSDQQITKALLLGNFEKALEVCISEGRTSDGLMIAICGGSKCITKAQKAFFQRNNQEPSYIRLLQGIVNKDLWDLAHNGDLGNWKEILASICTYAGASEFPDLCEVLGDRLHSHSASETDGAARRGNATFCFLAGSKLEKVVEIWLADLGRTEVSKSAQPSRSNGFALHAQLLQDFIEKVTVFREATNYQDDQQGPQSDWKLGPLYDRYVEYADILSAHGQHEVAERYLSLLPTHFAAADTAKTRIRHATSKQSEQTSAQRNVKQGRAQQKQPPGIPQMQHEPQLGGSNYAVPTTNQYAPSFAQHNPNAPSGSQLAARAPPNTVYQGQYTSQTGFPPYGGMQQMQAPNGGGPGAPPQVSSPSTAPPPSKAQNMGNWNDMPDSFFKPPTTSRRGTPVVSQSSSLQSAPTAVPSSLQSTIPPRSTPPLAPPPKAGEGPPRVTSPPVSQQSYNQQTALPAAAPSPYAPPTSNLPVQNQATIPRGPSPYNAPPPTAPAANRYTPSQSARPPGDPINMAPNGRAPAAPANQYAPKQDTNALSGPPPIAAPPRAPANSAEPSRGVVPKPDAKPSREESRPAMSQYRDRSHIPEVALPIYQVLNGDMQRVKSRAPASFKAQVENTEKRLNILFDHLNNEDLLEIDTIHLMVQLAHAIQARDYENALAIHLDILTNKNEQCGNWMVGVKRLIAMSRATP